MPQQQSDSTRYLQWVARNLNHFEFLSSDARKLRNDVRRWFYGRQDAKEAEKLAFRFRYMFSNNIIQDALSVPFGAILNQTHINNKKQKLATTFGTGGESDLSISYIVGRTIRVYGGPEDDWRDQDVLWKKLQESRSIVEKKLPDTINTIKKEMNKEKARNRKYGLSGFGLISTLILIMFGLMMLFQTINVLTLLVKGNKLYTVLSQMPARVVGFSAVRCFFSILFCFVGAVIFVLLLPRLLTRLRGSFMWLFQLRRNYNQRKNVCAAIEKGMKLEGLKRYSGKVLAAARKLKQMPDYYENEDPTTDVLGTNCLKELFEGVAVPGIPRDPAGLDSLLDDMGEHALLSPLSLMIAAAVFAVICIPALLNASTAERIQEKLQEIHMNNIDIDTELGESAIEGGYTVLRPDQYSSSAVYLGSEQSFTMMALQDGSNDTFWASDDLPAWICYNYENTQVVDAIALASGNKEGYGIHEITISMCLDNEVVFDRAVRINSGYSGVQILRFGEGIEADSLKITIDQYQGDGDVVYVSQFLVLE